MGFPRRQYWSGLPFPSPHMATPSSKCPYEQQKQATLNPNAALFLKEGRLDRTRAQGVINKLVSGLFSPFFSLFLFAAATAKSLQLCLTLCNPIDGSPPGSPIPGILQARTLEWVAISFSDAWMWKVKVKLLSCVRLLATPWTAAYQAPPSMGFSRQE